MAHGLARPGDTQQQLLRQLLLGSGSEWPAAARMLEASHMGSRAPRGAMTSPCRS